MWTCVWTGQVGGHESRAQGVGVETTLLLAGACVLPAACARVHVPTFPSLCPQGRGVGSQQMLAKCVTSSLNRGCLVRL